MSLIHRFKYEGKMQLARPLGRLLFEAFIKYWPKDAIDLIQATFPGGSITGAHPTAIPNTNTNTNTNNIPRYYLFILAS